MAVEYLQSVNLVTSEEFLSQTGYSSGGKQMWTGSILFLNFLLDDGKIIYVCQGALFESDSTGGPTWSELNRLGLIKGKIVTLGGLKYKCRVLTGGNKQPIADAKGGEYDAVFSAYNGFNENQNSLCQEYYLDETKALCRTKSNLTYSPVNSVQSNVCWRPVLELLDIPPEISVKGGDLGTITVFNPIKFTIKDKNTEDKFTINVKVDGKIIQTKTSQEQGIEHTLDIQENWKSISYGSHTLELEILDPTNQAARATYKFIKSKNEIVLPVLKETLKQQVAFNEEIEEEIKFNICTLKDNLSNKGVDVSTLNKMGELVNGVKNIELGKKWASGKISSGSATKNFTTLSGRTVPFGYIDINIKGLSFKPNLIVAMGEEGESNFCSILERNKWCIPYAVRKDIPTGNTSTSCLKCDGLIFINEATIRLPLWNLDVAYTWMAFE